MKYFIVSGFFMAAGSLALFLVSSPTEVRSEQTLADSTVPAATSSVYTIPVSGVVRATQDIVLFAQTSGTVNEFKVSAGQTVRPGAVLARSSNPVLLASYDVATINAALTLLQQENGALETQLAYEMSTLHERTTLTEQQMTERANTNRVEEVQENLIREVQAARNSIPDILRFIQSDPSRWSAETNREYQTVVKKLYGTVPNYLRFNDILTGGREDGIFTNFEQKSNTEILSTAPDVIGLLESLEIIFRDSEKEFMERGDEVASYNEYLKYLELISGLTARLQARSAALAELNDSQNITKILRDSALEGATLERDSRERLAQNAETVTAYTKELGDAEIARVSAELSLGIIRSPFSGTITETYVDIGSYVQPGTPLMRLVGSDLREVTMHIPAHLASALSIGDELYNHENNIIGNIATINSVHRGLSTEVTVTLLDNTPVGAMLYGAFTIPIHNHPELHVVSRQNLIFEKNRIFIQHKSENRIPVEVVSDNGAELLVRSL